jgi:hypothetical protein
VLHPTGRVKPVIDESIHALDDDGAARLAVRSQVAACVGGMLLQPGETLTARDPYMHRDVSLVPFEDSSLVHVGVGRAYTSSEMQRLVSAHYRDQFTGRDDVTVEPVPDNEDLIQVTWHGRYNRDLSGHLALNFWYEEQKTSANTRWGIHPKTLGERVVLATSESERNTSPLLRREVAQPDDFRHRRPMVSDASTYQRRATEEEALAFIDVVLGITSDHWKGRYRP